MSEFGNLFHADHFNPRDVVLCPTCGKRMKLSKGGVFLWMCPDAGKSYIKYPQPKKSQNEVLPPK